MLIPPNFHENVKVAHYCSKINDKTKRKQNVIKFNLRTMKETNIDEQFLLLIDKHFPRH